MLIEQDSLVTNMMAVGMYTGATSCFYTELVLLILDGPCPRSFGSLYEV